MLTAAEGLHALAAALSQVGHLRFVHEVDTTEDGLLRLIGAAVRRRSPAVVALCPTPAVQAEVSARFPHLDTRLVPFALADADAYIPDVERAASGTIPDQPSIPEVRRDAASVRTALSGSALSA